MLVGIGEFTTLIFEPILVVGLGCSLGVRAFDPWPPMLGRCFLQASPWGDKRGMRNGMNLGIPSNEATRDGFSGAFQFSFLASRTSKTR